MKVDTESDLAWQQYLANLRFARGYQAHASRQAASHADFRVLVTGFGRFANHPRNATGLMVSELVDGLLYPELDPVGPPSPRTGAVDPPELRTAVAQGMLRLPVGNVAVCAMVLPVSWDLAPLLVLKEAAAFAPHLVLMNGIAGPRQELHLELGAVNRAKFAYDGSDHLRPEDDPLIPAARPFDYARGNLASWQRIRSALASAIAAHADDLADGQRFGDIVLGVRLAGFPRANTYLCNNTTYTVGYLMDHPGERVHLLEASHVRDGKTSGVEIHVDADLSGVPRLFIHWPSDLRGGHLRACADILRVVIDVQLAALSSASDKPVRGDNALAELPATEVPPVIE